MKQLGVLALTAVLLVACSGDDDAGPSPTTQPTSPTSIVDYTGVVLPGVGGETTTTIDEVGTARLVGTVAGPRGPVAGATVRIDRFAGGREVRRDVVAGPDGRWELRDVPGGRYRVRAFLAPVYAQTQAEVRFLADGEEHRFDLTVDDQRQLVVRADVAPDQPRVGGDVNLVVLVALRVVTPDGIVRPEPVEGAFVELLGLGRWVVRSQTSPTFPGDTTSTTFDSGPSSAGAVLEGGRARFELRCDRAGDPGLVLRVPVQYAPDPVPPAAPGASTTTTTIGEPVSSSEDVRLELPGCAEAPAPTTTSTTTP